MATTLTTKPLDFFKPDPGNPRRSSSRDELRELRDSLIKKQLVPLLARPDGTIIDGWRRWSAAKLDGKNAGAYYQLGEALLRQRESDRAIAAFDQAINLKPDYTLAFNLRGLVYAAKGNAERAIAAST